MTCFKLVFNAPFHTGIYLNSRDAILGGYERIDEKLKKSFDSAPPETWTTSRRQRLSGLKIDVDDRRGTTNTPSFIAERSFSANIISDNIRQRLADALPSGFEGKVRGASIRICEHGYGSLLVHFDIEAPPTVRPDALRDAAEAVSSNITCFEPFIEETTKFLKPLIPEEYLDDEINDPSHEINKIAWVHRVFLIPDSYHLDASGVEEIVFKYDRIGPQDLSIEFKSRLYIGSGNSVFIYNEKSKLNYTSLLYRTIQMQNVFYIAFESLDRKLYEDMSRLSRQVDMRQISSIKKINTLEEKSKEMVDQIERAEYLKARFRDYGYHLDPQSSLIWEEICKCWGLDSRIRAVDERIQTIEKIYDRTRDSLKSLYDSQLNWLVLAFTLAGFFSVLVDTISFVQEEGLQWPDAVRTGILGAMLMLVVFLAALLVRKRTPV